MSLSKKTKYVAFGITGTLVVLIAAMTIWLSLPSTHEKLGKQISDLLTEKIGTEVSIEKVRYIFPNVLLLQNVTVPDQKKRSLLTAEEIEADVLFPNVLPWSDGFGKIHFSYIKLLNPQTHIVEEEDSTCNFQFIADSLSNPDSSGSTNIEIAKVVVKNLDAKYESVPSNSLYSVSDFNITAKELNISDQKISVELKNINFDEAQIQLDGKNYTAQNFQMDSNISLYSSKGNSLKCDIEHTEFSYSGENFTISDTEFFIKDNLYNIHSLNISSDKGLALKGKAVLNSSEKSFSANIDKLSLSKDNVQKIADLAEINQNTRELLGQLGMISFKGSMSSDSLKTLLNGNLKTDLGNVTADATLMGKEISGEISSDNLYLANLVNNPDLGRAAFTANITANTDNPLKENTLKATIQKLEYKAYNYTNIDIDETSNNGVTTGMLDVNDPRLRLKTDYVLHTQLGSSSPIKHIQAEGELYAERLALVPLLGNDAPSSISVNINGNIDGTDIHSMSGNLQLNSVHLVTDRKTYSFEDYNINIINKESDLKEINIQTDFADATITGNIDIDKLPSQALQQVWYHLPSLGETKSVSDKWVDFDINLRQSNMLATLIGKDFTLDEPVHIIGNINNEDNTMDVNIDVPKVSYGANIFANSTINILGNSDGLKLNADINRLNDNEPSSFIIDANAHDDAIGTSVNWDLAGKTELHGVINAQTHLTDSLGKLQANIGIEPSDIFFDNMRWLLNPSEIKIYGNNISLNNLHLTSNEKFVTLNGKISDLPDDTLYAEFNGFDIAYLQDLLHFHPVDFGGNISGHAKVSEIYGTPEISADVTIDSLLFETGYLGKGDITVGWDRELKGVRINGHIVDENPQNLFSQWPKRRVTDVSGYVAPREVRDDIQLQINAQNTSAEFINGFLGGVFNDVKGDVNGIMNVTTGPNGVNLIGKMSVDADLQLRATNVVYHISPRDSIIFEPGTFVFDMVQIHDINGRTGYVNGKVTHTRLRNFGYNFEVDFDNFLLYDEKEFNSDKFLATVYGSGNLTINGSDGHNLYMTADVTPNKGSVFAYDAATPDAINSGNFITFRSKNQLIQENTDSLNITTLEETPSHKYSSDIYLDINIHINPDCAVKLRMDNNSDGYITTYGNGTLIAHYHDKSPFTMQGIYRIQSGKYRLYLQDIIYRDLELQEGSNVTFNGNPFDANIHLICWHTLSAVPLRDLTSSAEFMQNNKVKVVCILDITGQLGNMNFGFDLQLPNVSDETRQLVKSLISTDEEMNMQMIYLLGLGRFYTNEMARAQGKTSTGNEVSSLVSSTISGQLNNLIDNVVGANSKWSFGTGLSTGEKGWDDLDVEGTLSGSLLNDRLLINGNFGYRDNALTNKANFVGDFDVRYRLIPDGGIYLKAYNQTNDKYFTKSTLNTQGIGISFQREFDNWKYFFKKKPTVKSGKKESTPTDSIK